MKKSLNPWSKRKRVIDRRFLRVTFFVTVALPVLHRVPSKPRWSLVKELNPSTVYYCCR